MIVVDLDRDIVLITLNGMIEPVTKDVIGMSSMINLVVQSMAMITPKRMAPQPMVHAVTAAAANVTHASTRLTYTVQTMSIGQRSLRTKVPVPPAVSTEDKLKQEQKQQQ